MRYVRFILALSFIFYSSVNIYADSNEDTLKKARSFVEQKKYEEAIQEYAQIEEYIKDKPDLLVERARVFTYANAHTKAIKHFEDIRVSFSEHGIGIMRELAEQYRWNDQLEKSVEVYQQALASNKNDINLLLGLADVLSHLDRLEESLELYERVLENNPENLTALNSRARVMVWQGYHRRGSDAYNEIILKYPDNVDAHEGLAYARHWQGQDGLANSVLEKVFSLNPEREWSKKLAFNIKKAQQPHITFTSKYSKDKNNLAIRTHGLRAGEHIDDVTRIEGAYEWLRFRQPDNTIIDANRTGLGFFRSFGEEFEFNSTIYGTHFKRIDFDVVTANAWLTYMPDDILRFDFAYDRYTFEDINALINKIYANAGSVSFDLRPNRWWLLAAKYQRAKYSDSNNQDVLSAKLEYRFSHKPFVKLYYNYYYSNWGKSLNSGYFNPETLNSHTLGIYSGVSLTDKLFVEAQTSIGHEVQNNIQDSPTYFAAVGLNYRMTENWFAGLRGEYFTVRKDNDLGGYGKNMVSLRITYNFGSDHSSDSSSPRITQPITR